MMTESKHTALRHQILREVADGKLRVYVGIGKSLVRPNGETLLFLSGQHKRAAVDLSDSWTYTRYPGTGQDAPAQLTEYGRHLLAEWDTKHPQ
jgi:hypothetical protein